MITIKIPRTVIFFISSRAQQDRSSDRVPVCDQLVVDEEEDEERRRCLFWWAQILRVPWIYTVTLGDTIPFV